MLQNFFKISIKQTKQIFLALTAFLQFTKRRISCFCVYLRQVPRLTLSKRSAFSAVKDAVLRPQTSSFFVDHI